MLPHRAPMPRIPGSGRLLRPPILRSARHPSRPFTQQSRRQVISPPLGRPQLPFLTSPAGSRPLPPLSLHLRQHFARLVSTESRDYYRRRISNGLKIGLSFYAILVLFQVMKLGVYQEDIEHKWPTPPEWSWKSRWCLRSAQALQHPEQIGKLMTNWPMVAGYLKDLLERLEDPEGEGKGIMEQEDGGFLVEGVGKMGYDVSAKSEPWRRGYFQALMGAAKAAESLEGWMTDRKQRISAPAEYVVGPSNPRPRPMPAGQKAPLEENCEAASSSPESFYMKILTTRGFDTRQKVEAALSYADWLDYKGLKSTSRDMYSWAMDIAAAGSSVDATKVVDLKTGVLKNDGKLLPSENIIRVSTALAVHHAKQGDLPNALSIFTSVLKARRSLPAASSDTALPYFPSRAPSGNDPFRALFNSLKTVLVPVKYPPPQPSGDEPPQRTPTSVCDEAGLMTYIGEIIYASSSKEGGLAWTRDAVDLAEATIFELGTSEELREPRDRCADCLRVGIGNWKTMVSQLIKQAEKDEQETIEKAKKAWYGGQKQIEAKTLERKRWEAERLILDDRTRRLRDFVDDDTALKGIAPNSSLFT
ncbi:hypothetical protein CBS63078_7218 [Aspergillus niger]|nr:hypothetical protein CBS11852_8874 [Aspergillus niger]KAI2896226.1 hypothetical protein CBS13152_3437 [Aspergillus niger]KAI2899822.1 hypothetical protein CBS63078_7218 [Aspergillus niger]KAI2963382.1 hypothetical protein CBS147323_6872 [Aspergillus niger]KAI3039475.1 hypothetical protein CBS76997_7825 [Aspergillus niger]